MTLTREEIFAVDDLPREEVPISEWGGSVFVRALNGAERDQLERISSAGTLTRAQVVALCAVDEEGNRLFTDADVDRLAMKHGAALGKIMSASLTFNRLTPDSVDDAKN